jgi:hypothetical protein
MRDVGDVGDVRRARRGRRGWGTCQKFEISTGPLADPSKKRILYKSHDVASNVEVMCGTWAAWATCDVRDVGNMGDVATWPGRRGDMAWATWRRGGVRNVGDVGRDVSSVPRVRVNV